MIKEVKRKKVLKSRRYNQLNVLQDMPNTVHKLQYARTYLYRLAKSSFEMALQCEDNEARQYNATGRDALRDMVTVCNVLLPYQTPKLAAVDVRHTDNRVLTVIHELKRTMELQPGAEVGKQPLLASGQTIDGDIDIDIDEATLV